MSWVKKFLTILYSSSASLGGDAVSMTWETDTPRPVGALPLDAGADEEECVLGGFWEAMVQGDGGELSPPGGVSAAEIFFMMSCKVNTKYKHCQVTSPSASTCSLAGEDSEGSEDVEDGDWGDRGVATCADCWVSSTIESVFSSANIFLQLKN